MNSKYDVDKTHIFQVNLIITRVVPCEGQYYYMDLNTSYILH